MPREENPIEIDHNGSPVDKSINVMEVDGMKIFVKYGKTHYISKKKAFKSLNDLLSLKSS